MDPQSRILLEQTHQAMIDGTQRIGLAVPAQTGVYVGVMHMEYLQYLSSMGVRITPNVTTGNGMDFLIGRVSYMFGFTGPCLRLVIPASLADLRTAFRILHHFCTLLLLAVRTLLAPRLLWPLTWRTPACVMGKLRQLLQVECSWCSFREP